MVTKLNLFPALSVLLMICGGGGLITPSVAAGALVNREGIVGYDDTPMLPWVDFRKHDPDRPVPLHVEAFPVFMRAPADAIVLFDGSGLSAWAENEWSIKEGILVSGKGELNTKQVFGDCQIHIEFKLPVDPKAELFNRGNNGLAPMGFYEIQIFDSHPMHAEQIYADGQCAAIYGETPPLLNACREPGEWQSFDLVFTAPKFDGETLVSPARVTLFHNGVIVHLNEPIRAPTVHKVASVQKSHPKKLPLRLKGHSSAVQFRNIWLRPLEP